MIYGKIKSFEIITLNQELSELPADEKSLESYIRTKHETAELNGRYIVKFIIQDARFLDHTSKVSAMVPKTIIDNNLIVEETDIECNDSSCSMHVWGVEVYFDRSYNGTIAINDPNSEKINHGV